MSAIAVMTLIGTIVGLVVGTIVGKNVFRDQHWNEDYTEGFHDAEKYYATKGKISLRNEMEGLE